MLDLDASFTIDQEARLRLIHKDGQLHRRQSLAPFSTARTKMSHKYLKRATSNLEAAMQIFDPDSPSSASRLTEIGGENTIPGIESVSKACKSGLMRAKKQLKAFLSKKPDSSSDGRGAASEENLKKFSVTSFRAASTKERIHISQSTGHNFKMTRIHKTVNCNLCNKLLNRSLLLQGYRCCGCKLTFHKECANFAAKIPCASPIVSPVREHFMFKRPWESMRTPRPSISTLILEKQGGQLPFGSFNLTKTQQQADPNPLLIESINDLRQFSVFIFKKQSQLGNSKHKRETIADAIFKRSLKEFHMELIGKKQTKFFPLIYLEMQEWKPF